MPTDKMFLPPLVENKTGRKEGESSDLLKFLLKSSNKLPHSTITITIEMKYSKLLRPNEKLNYRYLFLNIHFVLRDDQFILNIC